MLSATADGSAPETYCRIATEDACIADAIGHPCQAASSPETSKTCFWDAGVGLLYRQALLEAFPGVEEGVRSLGDRLRGRRRSSLYQV